MPSAARFINKRRTGRFSKKATSKQPFSKSLSESGFIPAQKTAAPLLA